MTSRTTQMLLGALATLALLGASGCADDPSKCEATMEFICDKGCGCANTEGKCALQVGTVLTFSFTGKSSCKLLMNQTCSDPEADRIDLDACKTAVTAAQCTPPSATVKGSFPVPVSCTAPPADGGP